ncbi:hypothetical protein [Pseudoalteromonas luteoviolacea]|nr:hypothetical protein [Pseudoalteromonas luteoviolacea]
MMKLSLDKKRMKNLTNNNHMLAHGQTPKVAGGCNSAPGQCFGGTAACCSEGTCRSRYC